MIDKTLLKNDFEDILRDSHVQGKSARPRSFTTRLPAR